MSFFRRNRLREDLSEIKTLLYQIIKKQNIMSGELDNLGAQVERGSNLTLRAISLLKTYHADLIQAIATGDMSQVQILADKTKANNDALEQELNADALSDDPGATLPATTPVEGGDTRAGQ